MDRRKFLKYVTASASAATLSSSCSLWPGKNAAEKPAGKPNFIFFLIDDLGWSDLECYGSNFYETPNIDKLASKGMRFTDAYAAAPVCSPTRASIMTGKYPARIGITDWIPGFGLVEGAKVVPAENKQFLPLEEITIAESLQEAGYKTCFAGKWHLGGNSFEPEHQGFEMVAGGNSWGMPKTYFSPYGHPKLKDGPAGEYLTDNLTDRTIEFIHKNKSQPFLMFLSHFAVHIPIQAKEKYIAKYKAKAAALPQTDKPRFENVVSEIATYKTTKVRQIQDDPVYAGMIQSVDDSIGRVMKTLEDLHISENTIIILTSDNGGLSTAEGSPTSNLPLKAGKNWLYEGGIRVPAIIKWPGITNPGSICSTPITSTDYYPTMLKMAGIALKPLQHVDGVDILPLLKGEKDIGRADIFWHYPHYGKKGDFPAGAVREGNWKLIENYENNLVELYDIERDLSETKNLAARHPEVVQRLREKLRHFRKDTGAKMPTSDINGDIVL